ncbi:MAG: ADP-glyceromanno-heptose 6-epimerase [Bacteroidetes bacterium]|nr:ADP-glyceromanno-heptose 6-epimerase [Bacteroidota bacterium]
MIVVTGAAGFIPSCLVSALNRAGHNDIVAVDDFSRADKNKNLDEKSILERVERTRFFDWAEKNAAKISFVFHLGARTDTTEFNKAIFDELNVKYSQDMWNFCTRHQIPLVYASSAATYGMGEFGYEDSHEIVAKLKPLNPYGDSKNEFDKWVLQRCFGSAQQPQQQSPTSGVQGPPFWAGLKFFNVYGPNEYHKGRMASVIFHAFNQISENGSMKLFRSHRPDYTDGGQLRDFVYVKDVVNVCLFMMDHKPESGLYNLGTGKARTFKDLALATFNALNKPEQINFIDTPADIRDKYQYFTEADMAKLIRNGYQTPFHSLEEGVKDYVQNYLNGHRYF